MKHTIIVKLEIEGGDAFDAENAVNEALENGDFFDMVEGYRVEEDHEPLGLVIKRAEVGT